MKSKSTLTLAALLFFIPLSANAQGFGSLNINLNDVMVSQRMQDMSQRLKDADSNSMQSQKKEKHKRNKKHEDHRVACVHKTDLEQATTDNNDAVSSVSAQTN